MIYKLMKPLCIFKRINEFMIIIIDVFVLLFFVNVQLLINPSFFYGKIRNSMIYKVMKFVYILKRIDEFMTIIIDVFSVLILCKYSVTNKVPFLWEKLRIR